MTYRHLTQLADVLRANGLTVREVPGWKDRGRPSSTGGFDPVGVLCHHTATTKATSDTSVLRLLVEGRSDLPGPLCQLGLARDGTVYTVAAGRANHAGVAKASGTVAAGDGNNLYIGIEAFNDGRGEPWPLAQYQAYVLLCAVLSVKVTGNSVNTVRGHKETSVTGKIDPTFDMTTFRAHVAAKMVELGGNPQPTPEPGKHKHPRIRRLRGIIKRLRRRLRRQREEQPPPPPDPEPKPDPQPSGSTRRVAAVNCAVFIKKDRELLRFVARDRDVLLLCETDNIRVDELLGPDWVSLQHSNRDHRDESCIAFRRSAFPNIDPESVEEDLELVLDGKGDAPRRWLAWAILDGVTYWSLHWPRHSAFAKLQPGVTAKVKKWLASVAGPVVGGADTNQHQDKVARELGLKPWRNSRGIMSLMGRGVSFRNSAAIHHPGADHPIPVVDAEVA